MRRRSDVLFCVGLSLAACGPRYVTLEPKQIASIQLVPPTGGVVCANEDVVSPLRVDIRYVDGDRLSTSRANKPDALIKKHELVWSSNVGTIDARGAIALPIDRMSWLDQAIGVRVAVARDHSIARELTLVPVYDCGRVSEAGRTGSTGDGGGHGGIIEVALAYVELPGARRWVLARVTSHGQPARHYLVDPGQGAPGSRTTPPGRMVIDVRGGRGGVGAGGMSGSSGSSGSDGSAGSSGSGCDNGGNGGNGSDGGNGGDGGDGGQGGDGGDGGVVYVRYDERSPELVQFLEYAVDGGRGGAGGSGGTGGSGGSGGKGGPGGAGGSGGGDIPCSGMSGSSGGDGRDGSSGRRGSDGPAGRAGRAGEVRAQAVDVQSLFADERARGISIVVR